MGSRILYRYITQEVEGDVIRLDESEYALSDEFKKSGETVPLWLALKDTMEWVMGCIHFDTILEEAVEKNTSYEKPSYLEFVKLVQDGPIFTHLAEMIGEQYDYYISGYTEDRHSVI